MVLLHFDTDLGSDTDDACALAMLLGREDAEVVGVTTTIDPDGQRAGYAARVLELAGRADIPVEAGAAVPLSTRRPIPATVDPRYWPEPVAPRASRAGAAVDLLAASLDRGATLVAVGPYTNLALLEVLRPGSLARVPVVVMGGWIRPPAAGLPAWGPERDFNVQTDTLAARILLEGGRDLTMATLPATMAAHLRAADADRLRASGPLGDLLARQAVAYAEDRGRTELVAGNPGLPADLLNFHYDPVACAVALGWAGATVRETRVRPVEEAGALRLEPDPDGRPIREVVEVDGPAFSEVWLAAVEAAQR